MAFIRALSFSSRSCSWVPRPFPRADSIVTGPSYFQDYAAAFKFIEGNRYTWQTINHRPRLITTWHLSAHESPTNTYDWNGKVFE